MELKEWLVLFLRHKDIVQKKIKEIKEVPDGLIVAYKDAQKKFLIQKKLSLPKDNSTLVCSNTKENLKFLAENWQSFVDYKSTVYFANPLSKTEKKWIIIPYIHNSVADPESLKQGLTSMFETVDEA